MTVTEREHQILDIIFRLPTLLSVGRERRIYL